MKTADKNTTRRNNLMFKRLDELKPHFKTKTEALEIIAKELDMPIGTVANIVYTKYRKQGLIVYYKGKAVKEFKSIRQAVIFFELKGYIGDNVREFYKSGEEFDGYLIKDKD